MLPLHGLEQSNNSEEKMQTNYLMHLKLWGFFFEPYTPLLYTTIHSTNQVMSNHSVFRKKEIFFWLAGRLGKSVPCTVGNLTIFVNENIWPKKIYILKLKNVYGEVYHIQNFVTIFGCRNQVKFPMLGSLIYVAYLLFLEPMQS